MKAPAVAGEARERLLGADAVRAVAAVGVVAIHAVHWPSVATATDAAVWSAADRLSRFAVPAFVILSGALLQTGYADRPRGREFVRRRFTRTLLPWMVWALIFCITGLTLTGDVKGSGGIFNWWVYGTGHLWFLLLIPQLYLVFAVWPRSHLWRWASIAVVVQVILGAQRLLVPLALTDPLAQLSLWRGFLLFPYWLGYFALGIALASWIKNPPRGATWMVGASLATVAAGALLVKVSWSGAAHGDWNQGTGAFLDPLQMPFAVAVVVLCACVGSRLLPQHARAAAVTRLLSEWSLAIYILHPLLLDLLFGRTVFGLLSGGLPLSLLAETLVIALTVAGSLVVAGLLSYTPLAVTLGVTRRPLSRLRRRPTSNA